MALHRIGNVQCTENVVHKNGKHVFGAVKWYTGVFCRQLLDMCLCIQMVDTCLVHTNGKQVFYKKNA